MQDPSLPSAMPLAFSGFFHSLAATVTLPQLFPITVTPLMQAHHLSRSCKTHHCHISNPSQYILATHHSHLHLQAPASRLLQPLSVTLLQPLSVTFLQPFLSHSCSLFPITAMLIQAHGPLSPFLSRLGSLDFEPGIAYKALRAC